MCHSQIAAKGGTNMKMMIVDDEAAMHDQIKSCIPWKELGWELVGDAYNGEEACALINTHQPDIVICDIKMPLMDGLDFMQWLQNSNYAGKVIVLSGYGDFQYSRPAFKLNAFDYLLKPLNEAELLAVLSKAVEELQRASSSRLEQIREKAVLNQGLTMMRDELLTQLVEGLIKDEIEILVRAEQLLLSLEDSQYGLLVVKLVNVHEKTDSRYEGDREVLYFSIRNILEECVQSNGVVFRNLRSSNEFIVLIARSLFASNKVIPLIHQLHQNIQSYLKVKAIFGVSEPKSRLSMIPTSYHEGLLAAETVQLGSGEFFARFGNEEKKQAAAKTSPSQSEQNDWKHLGSFLVSLLETGSIHDEEGLLQKVDQVINVSSLDSMSMQDLQKAVSILLHKVEQSMEPSDQLTLLLKEVHEELRDMNVSRVRTNLKKVLEFVLQSNSKKNRTKSGKALVNDIKRFAEEHYQTVNLEMISQTFYLNKNYFCSLFKKTTGQTFSDYITILRIDHAKRLLAQTTLKTYEIADRVGYQDQRYFSKVFRQLVGCQPTEYRSKHQ
jgi:two-component system, response regulator YesN